MDPISFISALLSEIDSRVVLVAVLMLFVLIQEDITIFVAGVLAADGLLPISPALLALYAGVILADMALYALGALARSNARLARYIDHDVTAPLRFWLGNRYALTVFAGHFVPGLRFTTFAASGFFRYPLTTYIPMTMAGGLVLTLVLFGASYTFGSLTSTWIGEVRWTIAGVFILLLFYVGRRNLMAYRALKSASFEKGTGSI